MMAKLVFFFFIFSLMTQVAFGQSNGDMYRRMYAEINSYKRIYHVADSLTQKGEIGSLSNAVFHKADSLNSFPPSGYFLESANLIKQSKFNDASFLYYLGYLRFRYYNSANPAYQPSGDGALFASLKSVIGQPINAFLRTNTDNFISITRSSLTYYTSNDYAFFSKNKEPNKYETQAKDLAESIINIENNKLKYSNDWLAERKHMEITIQSLAEQLNSSSNTPNKITKKHK